MSLGFESSFINWYNSKNKFWNLHIV